MNILLKVDKEFFYKLKEDKLRREKIIGKMSWEIYIGFLFGLSKLNKNGGLKHDRK